jgi:hypothetical protein
VRFLIDNNISCRICSHLEASGHEAVDVKTLSMATATWTRSLTRSRRAQSLQSVDTGSASASCLCAETTGDSRAVTRADYCASCRPWDGALNLTA